MDYDLDALFKPKAVALIGASAKEYSIGNVIIKNLLHYGFKGPIYPINPKVDEVRGLKAFKTILEVPGEVDTAHIVIPPPYVPQEVENCGKKGVKAIIINTAGFKEMGSKGKALEDDFLTIAKKYGIRIFGPNCQGIINTDPDIKAYCDFTFTFPDSGQISIVAQSGGVGAVIMQAFHDMEIGMRMYASNGNASDISIPEIIRYYGNDKKTRAIVVYVESLSNPKEFMEIAKEVTSKKPILAMTAGQTKKGAEASKSHTGELAGSISMELIFKKTGILSFANQEDLCNAAMAFAMQPIPKGKRVGMITNTGGPAIIGIDQLINCGLEIPELSNNAIKALKETMFESASINNPLDVVATAGAPQFRSALDVMMNEEQIDSVYINFVTPPFVDCESVAREFTEVNNKQLKPIVCNYMTDKQAWKSTSKILKEGSIPCFDFSETAAKALSALVSYNEIKSRKIGDLKVFKDIKKDIVKNIIDSAEKNKKKVLSASEVYKILDAYNIPAAKWEFAKNANEASVAANNIGFPVVIKADSEKIIHKSDVGGVALNIKNQKEVREVVNQMQHNLIEDDLKFLVQKFLPKGKELIIGAKKEPDLGHLIMFGMGGIFVEIYKDVVFNIAPLSDIEITEMIDSLKASPIINGYRGNKGLNKEKIVNIIQRITQLVVDFPEIKELDMNPVLANNEDVFVIDARILI